MYLTFRNVCCVFANLLLIFGLSIFAIGFFPHKALLSGLAQWPEESLRVETPPPFDRLIFMVVDALRSDFVYGNASSFHFTQSLIRSGAAVPFTGHASPPTITMPRVKAITTGSVPSFLDLMLNFAESDTSSTLATQDTWLAQMKVKPDGKLIMYGDDTWLRLFPGFFEREDGTSSFFVSDFTEVDNNVTRHIPEELQRPDWSAMILHFLGLDHIGHKTGPKGPNMPAKQAEMDSIVQRIYQSMETQDHLDSTLLVLLGDHGMNDAGNHGASSAGEVSTALTFISPRFKGRIPAKASPVHNVEDFRYYDEVEQSDLAPTLAALLGFPVPLNNLGILIPKLLHMWSKPSDRLILTFQNAMQIRDVAAATFPTAFAAVDAIQCAGPSLTDSESLACAWRNALLTLDNSWGDDKRTKEALGALQIFLRKAQRALSTTASNYGLSNMYIGTAVAAVAVSLAFIGAGSSIWCLRPGALALHFVNISYFGIMFASSYVEEEHQFWCWALSAWLIILGCKASRTQSASEDHVSRTPLLAIILFGILRKWNQTGQKYAGGPDIFTELMSENPAVLWILIIATIGYFSLRIAVQAQDWKCNRAIVLLPPIVGLTVLTFKIAFTAQDAPELLESVPILPLVLKLTEHTTLVKAARVVFLGLAHLLVCGLIYDAPWKSVTGVDRFQRHVHNLLSLFLITQTRTSNVSLFLLFATLGSVFESIPGISPAEITVSSLLLQYSSFFALGGTNAISSVDLSNAYNGISGYSVGAVGLLTFISNWAGPIWWCSAFSCIRRTRGRMASPKQAGASEFASLTVFASVSTLAVMVACTMLREHLFIWTVFSPKYLYCVAWVVAQHIGINGLSALSQSVFN